MPIDHIKMNPSGRYSVKKDMNQILINIIGVTMLSVMPLLDIACRFATVSEPNSIPAAKETTMETEDKTPESELPKTEREWKQKLDREQYYVLREKGTERAFTGKYDKFYEPGVYKCAGCGELLFSSESKYNSGCGWPAFSAPANKEVVEETRDTSLGRVRTEITCSNCGGHLGHVFNDGPAPTGQRYCINSASLEFEKEDEIPEK